MGLFSQIRRNYKNAGANLHLFLYFVDSYEGQETWPDPVFSWSGSGLQLHNQARVGKKQLLIALNEGSESERESITIPDDYWSFALRIVVNNYNKYREEMPEEIYEFSRDCLSVIAETAFEEFRDGETISVIFITGGDTWVEALSTSPEVSLRRENLGNVHKNPRKVVLRVLGEK